MDDINPSSMPSPQEPPPGTPETPHEPPHEQPHERQAADIAPRARFTVALIALYLCSAIATMALLWRSPDDGGKQSAAHKATKPFLSALKPASTGNIGWVSIHGPIYHSNSGKVWDRGIEQWSRKIRSLADKSEVKAIILDINSPGGSVGAVQELYSVILRVRNEKKKPVVALVGDVAASGGYYLAAACDKVVVHPGSLLGSIGVIFNTMNVEQLFSKLGLKSDPIKSGKLKDIGSPTRPMTKEERDLLQALIDDAYGQFLAAVAQGRGMKEDALRPLADGRIFSGRQALTLGLADTQGDAQDAIALAGKLAGISGTPKLIRDGEGIDSLLSLIDSKLSVPGLGALGGAGVDAWLHQGLEYRWMGL